MNALSFFCRNWIAVTLLTMVSFPSMTALAGNTEMPPLNPFLADSVVAAFHANSGQTGATSVPGPRGRTRTIAPADILWKKVGPGDGYSFQYSGLYPNGKRVGWFGGGQQLFKLDADTLDTQLTYIFTRGKYWTPEEIEKLIARADRLKGQEMLDLLVPPMTRGFGMFRVRTPKGDKAPALTH